MEWDNHQSRIVNDAVLSDLAKQARQLQRVAHHALERITEGEAESLSVAELCLMLRTVCSLAECSASNGNGFPNSLPAPVFHIVTYAKPESHCWVKHQDDPQAEEGLHVPHEIALAIQAQFPHYLVIT